jgi:hypothetical protein
VTYDVEEFHKKFLFFLKCVKTDIYIYIYIYIYMYTAFLVYIQGVSGGIVNVLGGGSMNYSE